jgi:hypothetical protein
LPPFEESYAGSILQIEPKSNNGFNRRTIEPAEEKIELFEKIRGYITMERNVYLNLHSFKIDSANAKAMIDGFKKDGKLYHQAIYCIAKDRKSPALITLDKHPTKFPLSKIGRNLYADKYSIPYKYIASLEGEYPIKNNITLWEEVCNNGLFDIWAPEAPYSRFEESKLNSKHFRIILLRVYEILEEFSEDELERHDKFHKIMRDDRMVTLAREIISDDEFRDIKDLLKKSIDKYGYEEKHPHQRPTQTEIKKNVEYIPTPEWLAPIIKKINKLKEDKNSSERDKESLVEDFYKLLEYKIPEEIKYRRGRIDISILLNNKIIIINEVKKDWNLSRSDGKVVGQAYHYAHETGARYVVITNGDYYAFYDRYQGHTYESNFMKEFSLSHLSTKDIFDFINKFRKENIHLMLRDI